MAPLPSVDTILQNLRSKQRICTRLRTSLDAATRDFEHAQLQREECKARLEHELTPALRDLSARRYISTFAHPVCACDHQLTTPPQEAVSAPRSSKLSATSSAPPSSWIENGLNSRRGNRHCSSMGGKSVTSTEPWEGRHNTRNPSCARM